MSITKSQPADKSLILDALVVGAGFSGMSALHRLRQKTFKVKIVEASNDYGGVWHYNHYPGARVDSEWPFYQLNIPEVQETWTFTERFCDHHEIRRYIAHVAKTLRLREDTLFNAKVIDARFNEASGKWTVKTEAGHVIVAQHLILATGLFYQNYIPAFPGLEKYKGRLEHTAFWPESLDTKEKKIAVIGAGATGVQVVQELTKDASRLTHMLRRPSYCLPMAQRKLTKEEQVAAYGYFPVLFEQGRKSRMGMPVTGENRSLFSVSVEDRQAIFEKIWAPGAFNFLARNFNDIVTNAEANKIAYQFWAEKVRSRFSNKEKGLIMAPLEPIYPFGTKRTPLEQDYYDCLDQPHVDIVDLSKTSIVEFTEQGLRLSDGTEKEFDIVVLATGFDTITGSLGKMGLKNTSGVDLRDSWKEGVHTYLGMMMAGFPNAYMCFTAHAPTALSNGPTIIECQLDWIVDAMDKLRTENYKSLEPTIAAEVAYKHLVNTLAEKTLFPMTSSWWTGGNVAGRKSENLIFVGGIQTYETMCREKLATWEGFTVVPNDPKEPGDRFARYLDSPEFAVKEEKVQV